MYSFMYAYVYIYIFILCIHYVYFMYIYLSERGVIVYKWNEWQKDGTEELVLFCYSNVLFPWNGNGIVLFESGLAIHGYIYIYISRAIANKSKKEKYNLYAKERKWSHIKC